VVPQFETYGSVAPQFTVATIGIEIEANETWRISPRVGGVTLPAASAV
jgi:hypothetical protein